MLPSRTNRYQRTRTYAASRRIFSDLWPNNSHKALFQSREDTDDEDILLTRLKSLFSKERE